MPATRKHQRSFFTPTVLVQIEISVLSITPGWPLVDCHESWNTHSKQKRCSVVHSWFKEPFSSCSVDRIQKKRIKKAAVQYKGFIFLWKASIGQLAPRRWSPFHHWWNDTPPATCKAGQWIQERSDSCLLVCVTRPGLKPSDRHFILHPVTCHDLVMG